jgi:hypothetical protein
MSQLMEKSVAELEIDQGELLVIRHALSQEKHAIQAQLVEINAACSTRIPPNEFSKLQNQRRDLVKALAQKESEILSNKSKIRELLTVVTFKKRHSFDPKVIIAIRNDWQSYSLCNKIDPVKRRLAWQFAQQLTEALRPYFAARPGSEDRNLS